MLRKRSWPSRRPHPRQTPAVTRTSQGALQSRLVSPSARTEELWLGGRGGPRTDPGGEGNGAHGPVPRRQEAERPQHGERPEHERVDPPEAPGDDDVGIGCARDLRTGREERGADEALDLDPTAVPVAQEVTETGRRE